jgi:AmmeMemoRadiSam system protein A
MEMTVAASSRDMRFRPVTKGELKDITIEISVMSPLKLITSVDEIKVGTHGLYIVKGGNAGLLLPQVAAQYKWGREEFLQNTCAKARLPENTWKDKETKIYVFSAQIFSE